MSDSQTASIEPVRNTGTRLYFLANLSSQVAALIRYVVLARTLGPAELGLAATLVVIAAFFDMASDTGSDRHLIQDQHGDSPEVQGLVHFVLASRGGLVVIGMLLSSFALGAFYQTPRLALGIQLYAIVPAIAAFQHLDFRRLQRQGDFRPEATMMIIAEWLGLAVTTVVVLMTHNFMAIIAGLSVRALALVTVSHLLAKRPYRLAYSREHAPAMTQFSGPLIINGLMLFAGSQTDRLMIGKLIGFAALGGYSATLLMVYYPSALLLRLIHNIYIPIIARQRDAQTGLRAASERLAGQTYILAIGMTLGFAAVTPIAAPLMYGARFAQPVLLIALIGALQITRFIINWPTTVALALGRSRAVTAANMLRLTVAPLGYVGWRLIGGLNGVVAGFIAGETFAILVAVVLMGPMLGQSRWKGLDRPFAFTMMCLALAMLAGNLSTQGVAWAAAGVVGLIGCLVWFARKERALLKEGLDQARQAFRRLRRVRAVAGDTRP